VRLDDRAAKAVAEWIAGEHRGAWAYFDTLVRSALVDAGIMAHVRAARSADDDTPFTAADLTGFRDRIVALLAAGVGRGHRRIRLHVFESPQP
jgi:hypothetical protein